MNQNKAVDIELTKYVAEFVVETASADLSAEVIELGKKSILDGFGLALSGSVAKSGELVRQHLGRSRACRRRCDRHRRRPQGSAALRRIRQRRRHPRR